MICNICGNSGDNKPFQIKEMMFGFRDEFTYFECAKCGCLQIEEIPKNMEKYYPLNYYSFQKQPSKESILKRILRKKRDRYAFFQIGLLGKKINKMYPNVLFETLKKIRINPDSKILDIGCGNGSLLHSLDKIGFRKLTGIDPYIAENIVEGNVKILKNTIDELPPSRKFNLIIFNHSFEHIPNPLETLIKVRELLSKDGVCLIRMPVKTDYIWKRYGVNWVQIDAPRHFFIYTLESFNLLAEKSALAIKEVIFDSTKFQFWGSEQYKNDIPLEAENSFGVNPRKSIFTKKRIKEFKKLSETLNKEKKGDQAVFILHGKGKKEIESF